MAELWQLSGCGLILDAYWYDDRYLSVQYSPPPPLEVNPGASQLFYIILPVSCTNHDFFNNKNP